MNPQKPRPIREEKGWLERAFSSRSGILFPLDRVALFIGNCKGSLLLETVVAVMVFSLVGTAVLSGVTTAYRAGSKVEGQSVAENLARNQMESAFNQPYQQPGQTPYPTISAPNGYTVSISASDAVSPPDPDIENITVTVSRDGQDILILTGIRFND